MADFPAFLQEPGLRGKAGARVKGECFVGCCGWTESHARYFDDFRAIELQSTFYEPPAMATAKRWRAEAPAEFCFSIKAWQLITHTPSSPTYRRLKTRVSSKERELYGSFRPTEEVRLAWERTRDIAEVLDARVVLFQCPRSFLPTRENLRNLRTFFHEIERGNRILAWEPRGDDWSGELVRELCAENDLIHCVDPFERDPAYGESLYWRLHGRGGYSYRYTDDDLDELMRKLRARKHLTGPHYIMFNNMYSRQDAMRFLRR